jgi:hypothetical protein
MEKKDYTIGILNMVLLCSIIASILFGCFHEESKRENVSKLNEKDLTEWTHLGNDRYIKNITVEQHKYIIIHGVYDVNIIHSESCPCKKESK